jgi:cytochrome P450
VTPERPAASVEAVPDVTQTGPVSLEGEDYYQDPWGFFARLRESRPVTPVHMPGYGRGWVITRYADVRAALADPRLARDLRQWPGGPRSRPAEDRGVSSHMLHADSAEHERLRRPVQKAFTPRRIERLRPRTAQVAADLAGRLAEAPGGVTDLVAAYARPLPVTVLCELLGVPQADRARVVAAVLRYDRPGEMAAVEQELAAYFTGLIAARRAEPADDLLSALVAASDEEPAAGRLTPTELVSTAYLLVMAGFDTTVNLIAAGLLALATHPAELARLRADRSLLPGAVEELLRFTSPVNHANDRFTTEEVSIGGAVIPAGEWVFAALPPANRDPARYPGPDRLDLSRDTSGHLAFGHGIHYCLGAPLARMEGEVALAALLDRFPQVTLAVPPDQLRWRPVSLMNGLQSLPVRLA